MEPSFHLFKVYSHLFMTKNAFLCNRRVFLQHLVGFVVVFLGRRDETVNRINEISLPKKPEKEEFFRNYFLGVR